MLNIAAAPLSWNGREFIETSKAYITLGEVSIEKQKEDKAKEEDGMIV